MPSDKPPKKKEFQEEDQQKSIKLIHYMAARLPWIVVFVVLLTAIVTIIEIYFSS